MSQLLSCPFCGGPAAPSFAWSGGQRFDAVECRRCWAQVWARGKDEAAAKWGQRPTASAEAKELREQLAEAQAQLGRAEQRAAAYQKALRQLKGLLDEALAVLQR